MSWEEQRQIALRRKHVAEGRSVHEWLGIAFQQAKDLRWKEEEFIQAVQEVLIYAFMRTGMSYRHAEEEVFRMLKRKILSQGSKDD